MEKDGDAEVEVKKPRTETFPFRMGATNPFSRNVNGVTGPTFYSDGSIFVSASAASRTLQPFTSPGTEMAAYYRFPFTWTQWQELERQALIYKYMMASVPVPSNLLIPAYLSTSNISQSTEGRGSFNRRFSHNVDPEPGRCRRTDGKKWRCSKDAAPGQKYCERHVHRGRPRSRKPVEFQSQTNNTPSAIVEIQAPSSGFLPNKQLPYQTVSETQERGPKYLNWMRGEGDHISSSNQSWKLMESKIGVKGSTILGNESLPLRQNEDYLNLNFSHFGNGDTASQQRYDPCSLFLNSELTLEDINQRESLSAKESTIANTALTNTWIKTEGDSGNGKVPFSSLKLFASGGNEGSMDQIQMGLGLSDSYMGCSKEPSFGGPLGEVLQSGTAGGESPQRVVSPTGVLQKAFGSVSDSSGSSSPTFAAAKSEVALQWLNNQAKLCD